jgi:hypothetical protein
MAIPIPMAPFNPMAETIPIPIPNPMDKSMGNM